MRLFLPVLACLVLSGCGIPGSIEMWAETKQYSGDGAIHTCSNLFAGGYGIDFPGFDASRPYSASYHLSHLPTGARERTGITLCFYQPDLAMAQEKQKFVTATFRLTLRDAKGSIVHSAEIPLATAGWSESQGLFQVYAGEKSYVHFERNGSYVLNVFYTPGAVPAPAKQLYLAINNCAFY